MKGDKKKKSLKDFFLCDSYRIQTYNLLIRSQMLYSVELRSQKQSYCLIASAKLQLSAVTANLFIDFFPLS